MRSMMLAAVLALFSFVVSQPVADACGGYTGPQAPMLYLVSQPHGTHTFVLLGGEVDESQHAWRRLEMPSYDRTAVADAPDFATPIELTLLGPSGGKQVTTRTQILVKDGFQAKGKPTTAARVPNGGNFRVAAFGHSTDLVWRDLHATGLDAASTRWAQDLGIAPSIASVMRDGDAEMLRYYDAKRQVAETAVRVGTQSLGTFSGSPIGTLTADGIRYAAFVEDGRVTTVSLGATAKARR